MNTEKNATVKTYTRRHGLCLMALLALLAPLPACGDDANSGVDGGVNHNHSTCGNTAVEGAEECDDGPSNSDSQPDACRTDCRRAWCGDGVTDTDEACDDGPSNSDQTPDGCRESCILPTCGDGVVDPGDGELCDDQNNDDGDGCSSQCQPEYCGNQVVDPGELCDDGNFDVGDGCSPDCLGLERCGDGRLDMAAGETCDCGSSLASKPAACAAVNGDPASPCSTDCKARFCGNNVLDPGELCEDGNNTPGDGCSPDCLGLEVCGDGRLDTATGETCDCGNDASNLPLGCTDVNGGQGTCSSGCETTFCGDGEQDPGEVCDDGNLLAGDGCAPNCRSDETCGNGVVDAINGELCDLGPSNSDTPNALCRTDCLPPHCGDRLIDTAFSESCDDGNTQSSDGCSALCGVEPHWVCHGEPSSCHCQNYYYGSACSVCAVLVDHSSVASSPDGRTWASAYPSVQAGIDHAAQFGQRCEVWIAQGTYYIHEGLDSNTVTLRSNVVLIGGFAGAETERDQRDWAANPTILYGGSASSGSHVYHAITAYSVSQAGLDGLTIAGGESVQPFFDESHPHGTGGGLYARNSDLEIRNTIWSDNQASRLGGAVRLESGTITVENSLFYQNQIVDAGGAGAVLAADDSTVTLTNCTLVDNVGAVGGGIRSDDSSITVVNSILWNNTSPALLTISGSVPIITYSCVEGGYAGTGNILTDPGLTSSYKLTAASPAIDVGDDGVGPVTDLAGNPRVDVAALGVAGVLTDMGAYEYQP